MNQRDRYTTSHLHEDQYEPGSRGRVLKNLRGIKRKREMDQLEAQEQLRALYEMTQIYGAAQRFRVFRGRVT